MDKVVVYCGTRNIYQIMEVSAKSMLVHTPVDCVYFLIEDDTFPSPLPDIIQTINVSGQEWFKKDGPNYYSAWTYMAFIRLALAKILPELHVALYLDTDTLVLNDASQIFNTNVNGKLFGMIQEDIGDIPLELCNSFSFAGSNILMFQSDNPRPEYCIRPYYNSGVMLMNLDEMRSTGMDDVLIHELNTVQYGYPDQDAINLLCADRIEPIPLEYNVIPAICPDFPFDKIRIKHFASEKPLWKSSLWQSYKRLSWQDVMQKQNALKEREANA